MKWREDTYNGKKEFTMGAFFIFLLTGIALVAIIATTIAFTVASSQCAYLEKQLKRNTHYHKLYGCYIETEPGIFVTEDQFRQYESIHR